MTAEHRERAKSALSLGLAILKLKLHVGDQVSVAELQGVEDATFAVIDSFVSHDAPAKIDEGTKPSLEATEKTEYTRHTDALGGLDPVLAGDLVNIG